MCAVRRAAHMLPKSPHLAYAAGMEHRPEDSALMLRYRDGDVAAFETLYQRHKDPLFRSLLRLCRQRAADVDEQLVLVDELARVVQGDSINPSQESPFAKLTPREVEILA